MYHFITKKEYFDALDVPEIDEVLKTNQHFGLKHVQDACVLHHMYSLPPGQIAEIGGGHSRTLPYFRDKGWICCNIEPFEGAGNGPRMARIQDGIANIKTYLGEFSTLLENNRFDVVYSISVIEHIIDANIQLFFQDMFRILHSGGQSWHAIDVYLEDTEVPLTGNRMHFVFQKALDAGFIPLQEEPLSAAVFRCSYATNPDWVMRQWNKSVPALKERRAHAQSVSLLLGLRRP